MHKTPPRVPAAPDSLATAAGKASPTRRAMIAGLIAAPVVAVPAIALAVPSSEEATFDKAFAAMVAAEAAMNHYAQTVEMPTWRAMQPAMDRVPHITASYYAGGGKAAYLTTASVDNLRSATAAILATQNLCRNRGLPRLPHSQEGDYLQACRRIEAHRLRREREFARIRRAHGQSAIYEQSEALSQRYCDAWDVLTETPPATVRQVAIKARAIAERNSPDDPYMLTIANDLARMAGIEAVANAR